MSLASKLNYLIETKNAIKNALINKGQAVSDSDTFRSYADKIANIETGVDTSDATASAADILNGTSAYVNGSKINGTMANNGAVTSTLDCGGSYTITAGYHNGSGKITANSLASQTSATATAADIASGKTAWVNGSQIIGTMSGGLRKFITNVSFTGNYAGSSSYYNQDFGEQENGVEIAYINNTDCVVMMRGGSSSSYEHLHMCTYSLPSGVTENELETTNFFDGNEDTEDNVGYLYAMILRGFDESKTYSISVNMTGRDGTDDAICPQMTVTEN